MRQPTLATLDFRTVGVSAIGGLSTWLCVWTALGLVSAVHLHLYFDVGWGLALWWGLKDWYLWGGLALAIVVLVRRFPIGGSPSSWLGAHLIGWALVAVSHAAASVLLSWTVEGLEKPYAEAVAELFQKKLLGSVLTYSAVVIAAKKASNAGSGVEEESKRESGSPAVPEATLLLIKKDRQEFFLPVDRIDRVEAHGNYVKIHAGADRYLERRTLKSLRRQLGASRFLQVHKSHLVNIERIRRIEPGRTGGYRVLLDNGAKLTLSRTFRRQLEERVGSLH